MIGFLFFSPEKNKIKMETSVIHSVIERKQKMSSNKNKQVNAKGIVRK